MVSFYETYTSAAFIGLTSRLKLNNRFVPTLSAQIENSEIVSAKMTQLTGGQIAKGKFFEYGFYGMNGNEGQGVSSNNRAILLPSTCSIGL